MTIREDEVMDKNSLYEKLYEEQQEYIDWLKSQDADTVLDNAVEFVWREDILKAFDAIELSEEQYQYLNNCSNAFTELLISVNKVTNMYDIGICKFYVEQARTLE